MAASRSSLASRSRVRLGATRSMKSVVVSPERKAGSRNVATRKSRLFVTPCSRVFSNTRAKRPAASRRVGA